MIVEPPIQRTVSEGLLMTDKSIEYLYVAVFGTKFRKRLHVYWLLSLVNKPSLATFANQVLLEAQVSILYGVPIPLNELSI